MITLQSLKLKYESNLRNISNILDKNLTPDAFSSYGNIKAEYEAVLKLINEKMKLEEL